MKTHKNLILALAGCTFAAASFASGVLASELPACLAQKVEPSKVLKPDQPTVEAFPGSEVERLTAAGLGRFSQGDFAGAVDEYSNAININPKRGGLYLQRGLTYLELEKYEEALTDLNKAYELDKANKPAILVCRGRALSGLGKYERALSDLDTAISEDPKFVLAYISRADTYLSKGEDDKALDDLNRALALDPKQAKAYFLRARYFKNKNNRELALKDFNMAVSLDSSFLDHDYGQTSTDRELRDHFTRELKLHKGATAHLVERGLMLERNGEYVEAIRALTDAITDSPDSLEAYKWRASVYMHMASYDDAIADVNNALALSPDDASLHATKAKAYLDLGQSDKALAEYSRAVELSHSPPASLFEARGIVYSRLGRSEEAIADFSRSIKIDPSGASAYVERGLENLVSRNYKDAIADFGESISRGQNLAMSYKFRGECKSYMNDTKGALVDLEKAAQLYKGENDLFGCRQLERMIADLKKSARS
jgi:tetratricopeptide (TPR) repeat protein